MKEAAESNLSTYVISRRGEIENAMARYFAQGGAVPSVEDKHAARRLIDVLIEAMRDRTGGRSYDAVASVPSAYVSKFGDGLVPILRDVIGSEVPATLLSQSIDGYWRGIRASQLAMPNLASVDDGAR